MLTYEEARKFIEETTRYGSVLGLTSMRALMEELGNVQNTIPTIHIAGTNGKGSVGTYLASICKEAGLKVGRYCSPAVFDPLECWQYDGRNITKDEYAYCMSQVKCACDIVVSKGIQPTVFEIETAMAFVYFAWKKPDVLLLEVGMGGETDATNVVDNPYACVFTTISYDHMQFLGNTLEEIASVKAGIMKPGAYVCWGYQEPEVESVLERKFQNIKTEGERDGLVSTKGVVVTNQLQLISENPKEMRFSYLGKTYVTQMAGYYQMQNAALAITVFYGLWTKGFLRSQEQEIICDLFGESVDNAIQIGIQNAIWPGRFEKISEQPLFIIDGAHNEDAAKQLSQTIENCFTNQSLTYIIGVLADKEHKKMLKIMLPYASKVYTITPQNARGLNGQLLLEEAKEVSKEQDLVIDMEFCPSVKEALDQAIAYGKEHNQPILAFGSLSYLGSLKQEYKHICESRNENDR